MSRILLQQAFISLRSAARGDGNYQDYSDVADALEAELAKPDVTFTDEGNKQEPVAQIRIKNGYWIDTTQSQVNHLPDGLHDLYTAPPRKEWVGLTREEIVEAYCSIHVKEWAIGGMDDVLPFTRAIEAKLKERNGAL